VNVLLAGESSGGTFTFLRTLAFELDRRGCQVTVALSGPKRPRSLGAESVELAWRPGRVEWMRDPWTDVDATGEWLVDLARRRRAEVVHVSGYAHAMLPFDAPVVLTAHSDLLTWSEAVGMPLAQPDYAEYERRVRAALRSAAKLVCPTAAHLGALERLFGPLPEAVTIHHGSRAAGAGESKQRLVLAAGRLWDEGKNLGALGGVPLPRRWTLAILGPRRHPESGSVSVPGARLLGDLDEPAVRQWLGRAAVFVDPALYEPFGFGVLEAAQAGCALVLADIPTLRELWGGAALFINPREPRALETALWLLGNDEHLLDELSGRAAQRAERFTSSAMADAYLSTYFALTGGRRLGRAS
jgi:glycogen synthase